MAFSGGFLVGPPHPHLPIHWNLHLCYIKGIQLVHIWPKCHLCLICISPVLKFQMFSAEGQILGCFWAVFWTWPTKMWSNLFETLTSDAMYHNSVGLWWSLLYSLKTLETEPKNQFSGSFREVFGLRLLTSYELQPNLQPNLTSYGGTYLW